MGLNSASSRVGQVVSPIVVVDLILKGRVTSTFVVFCVFSLIRWALTNRREFVVIIIVVIMITMIIIIINSLRIGKQRHSELKYLYVFDI